MQAELKWIHSPELLNLERDIPANPKSFCILFQLMIGTRGEDGEDTFDLVVLTPQWMLENWDDADVIFGFHHLIVLEYDYERIFQAIEGYVNSVQGESWEQLVNELRRAGRWEFEDYQDATSR